jgi:hypothetical protein
MHRAIEKNKAITKIILDVWFTWMTIEQWQIKYTNIRKVTLTFIDFKMQTRNPKAVLLVSWINNLKKEDKARFELLF